MFTEERRRIVKLRYFGPEINNLPVIQVVIGIALWFENFGVFHSVKAHL